MQIHDLIQGTPEWHAYRAAHFNASDAPAMMGCSPYKTRSELVREYATGSSREVDSFTQAIFDDGHRYEALARPLGEQIIGQDLYPVVGSDGKYSASFDGLTLSEDVGWEHKSLNDELRAVMTPECTGADLPKMYQVQMEQQCMVSGAGRVLFTASKWLGEELVEALHCWYEANESLRAEIVVGWAQFESDVAEYQYVEVLPAAVAAAVQDLPALSIRVDGQLTLNHNLVMFGERLQSFIADIDTNPSDDQAFANAEQAIKVMERAENALGAAEASALGQISTVDEMVRTVASYKELARKTRLMLEKVVKARKETIRVEIQQAAKDKAAAHIAALNTRLGKPYMPAIAVDFAGVMKGKKTVTSLRDAVDTELARFKIEANAVADKIQMNMETMKILGADHMFLFADAAQIVLKATDDFSALVKLRISDHKEQEEKKAADLRAEIQKEEKSKAEAAVQAKAAVAASSPVPVEAQAAPKVVSAPSTFRNIPVSSSVGYVKPVSPPSLRLGQVAERLGFALTADFLASLGFVAAGRERAAVLYHEQDFPAMCAALIRHIGSVQSKLAA